MATRSEIGILHKDGTIETIYCHWDGYLDGNGKILYENYNSLETVKKLLEKGSIESLQNTSEKSEYYDGLKEGLVNKTKMIKSLTLYKKYVESNCWVEHAYLFDEENNQWIYTKGDTFIPLKEALERAKIIAHKGEQFIALTYNRKDSDNMASAIGTLLLANKPSRVFYNEEGLVTLFWETWFNDYFEKIATKLNGTDYDYSLFVYDHGNTKEYGDIRLNHGDIKILLNNANLVCPSFQEKKPEYLENFMYINFVSDRDFETARSILSDYKAGKTMIASKRDNTLFWKNFSEEDLENLNNIILFFRRDRMREVYKENSICAEYSIILRPNETGFFRKIGELDDDKAYASLRNYLKDHNMTYRKRDFLPEEDESPSISM